MKKLILKLLFSVSFLFFISCETENLNDNTNTIQESKNSCIDVKDRSISIWHYPVSGHAMKCEVWEDRILLSDCASFRSRTTHYKWENGTFKVKKINSVYAKINGSNQWPYWAMSDDNNNINWHVATTNWISPHQNVWDEKCYSIQSTHRIRVNGVLYERTINLNDHW